jgi:hypothetical protein
MRRGYGRIRDMKSLRAAALILLASAAGLAAAAVVPVVESAKLSAPVRLDGKADEWMDVPRFTDPKSGAEFAFQNDDKYFYVLLVLKRPEAIQSAEATGLTALGLPGGRRKAAKGALFLDGTVDANVYIAWRESQGAVLTAEEKEAIRKVPRHPISLAFAVNEQGGAYGPLRKQTEFFPPDFAADRGAGAAVFELRFPLAPPDLVPGALGGAPGAVLRVSFEWGGTARKSLSTQASRESPGHNAGYQSGTGRTWGQEFLDTFDPMSRPSLDTRRFAIAVDVKLAGRD